MRAFIRLCVIWSSIIVISGALIACGSVQASGNPKPYPGKYIYERYDEDMASAERFYLAGDDENLAPVVEKLQNYRHSEAPHYEAYFFVSYLKYKGGDFDAAAEILADFKCMLKVDSGLKKCFETNNGTQISERCENTMCGELFFAYYNNPSPATLAWIARFWAYTDELEASLGRDIKDCSE